MAKQADMLKALKGLADRWMKRNAAAKEAKANITAELNEDRDGFLQEAESLGFPRRVFKRLMKKQDMLAAIDELRTFGEADEQNKFDEGQLLLGFIDDEQAPAVAKGRGRKKPTSGYTERLAKKNAEVDKGLRDQATGNGIGEPAGNA